MSVAAYPKLFILTDAAVNIAPTLAEKADIAQNAIDLARSLGVDRPKVAVLCATESVNPSMPATLDAAALSKMADRMQIRGALVDGPLALDNAISREAAELKGIASPVAGRPTSCWRPISRPATCSTRTHLAGRRGRGRAGAGHARAGPADQPRGFGAGAGGQLRDRGPARARLGGLVCVGATRPRPASAGPRTSPGRSSRAAGAAGPAGLRARIPGHRRPCRPRTALRPSTGSCWRHAGSGSSALFVDDAQIVVQIQQAPEVVVQQPGQRDADVFLRLHVAGDAGMLLEAGVDGVGGRRRGGAAHGVAGGGRGQFAGERRQTFLQRPDRKSSSPAPVAWLQASRGRYSSDSHQLVSGSASASSNIAGQRIEASNHACPRATAWHAA